MIGNRANTTIYLVAYLPKKPLKTARISIYKIWTPGVDSLCKVPKSSVNDVLNAHLKALRKGQFHVKRNEMRNLCLLPNNKDHDEKVSVD